MSLFKAANLNYIISFQINSYELVFTSLPYLNYILEWVINVWNKINETKERYLFKSINVQWSSKPFSVTMKLICRKNSFAKTVLACKNIKGNIKLKMTIIACSRLFNRVSLSLNQNIEHTYRADANWWCVQINILWQQL